MAFANAGTSYGESDEKLTAVFDAKFSTFETGQIETIFCSLTNYCTRSCTGGCLTA